MAWPGVGEFSKAIQHPGRCFSDWDLTQGEVAVYQSGGRSGMPVVFSGNFAAVYRVTCNGRDFAVRCFTRAVNDQRERYAQLDAFLQSTLPQSFVEFQYLEDGILHEGEWYPLVKMEWVDGLSLDKYVEKNLGVPQNLQRIAARWRGAVSEIGGLGIAHNDLQHGNVMVKSDRTLRLVDYDAMFLPDYVGQTSPENGHQNFQHPLRTSGNFNENIDRFPALVIYVSLLAIAADPGLFNKFYNDDNLLFRKKDFADPANSECFRILKGNNPDDTVRHLTAELERFCSVGVDLVPELEELLDRVPTQAAATAASPSSAPAPPPQATAPQAPPSQPRPTGSTYRDLLVGAMPQAASAAVITPPPPAPVATLTCTRCGQSNSIDLIFCENPGCITVLHQGQQFCAGCGNTIPSNAVYCHECGRKT